MPLQNPIYGTVGPLINPRAHWLPITRNGLISLDNIWTLPIQTESTVSTMPESLRKIGKA